jgi:hypothetical protein
VVEQKQTAPPPQVDGKSGGYDQYYQKSDGTNPQSQYRQLSPNGQPTAPGGFNPSQQSAPVKPERIAQNNGGFAGQVVDNARLPRSGVQVTFVSAKHEAADKTVTSDNAGRFQVDLPAGAWLVYVRTGNGQEVYHSRIDVGNRQQAPIMLVSR